jgi:hypothetical protein
METAIFYLVRVEPFTIREMEFQGGNLDAGDRTFASLAASLELMRCPRNKAAFECIPEIYCFPEMFVNNNDIAFPRATAADVSTVLLPA